MSIFKQRKEEDYINQLYDGKTPSMDYYAQLGSQKRERIETDRARKKLQADKERESTRQIREFQSKLEKDAKDKQKEKENQTEMDAFNNILNSPTKTISDSSPVQKDKKDKDGIFDKIGSWFGDVKKDSKKDSGLSAGQLFTRGAGSLIDGILPTNPVKDGLVKDFKNWDWLQDAFGKTDNKSLKFADTINDLAGNFVPGAAAYKAGEKVLDATSGVAKLGQKAVKGQRGRKQRLFDETQKGVLGSNLWGVQNEIGAQVEGKRENLGESTRNILLDTTIGAIADPALYGILGGLRRGAKPSTLRGAMNAEEISTPYVPGKEKINNPLDNSLSSGVDNLNDVLNIHSNKKQISQIDEMMNIRAKEFDAEQTMKRQEQLATSTAKRQELEDQLKNIKTKFMDANRNKYSGFENEKEIADGFMKWQETKDMRKMYDQLYKSNEKFYVPKQYKEEYDKLFPKSFITTREKSGNLDVFKAAEAHGFEGTHEGALELGHYLRSLANSKTTRMKDLVPKPVGTPLDQASIDKASELDFPQTDDAKAMQSVFDAQNSQIVKLENDPLPSFKESEEFTSTQGIKKSLQENIKNLDAKMPRKQLDNKELDELFTIKPPTNVKTFDGGNALAREGDSNFSKYDEVVQRGTDDLHGISSSLKKAKMETQMKFYEDARRVRGASGAAENYINNTLEKSIKEFGGTRKELQEAFKYINEKHLLDVVKSKKDYNLPGGANKEQLMKTTRELGSNSRIKKLATGVRDYQRGILDVLEEAGIVSSDVKDALIKEYPDYIPLFRQKGTGKGNNELDDVMDMYSKLKAGNVRKVIQELSEEGSSELTIDPITNLVQYGINAHHAAFSNKAMQNIVDITGGKINGKPLAVEVTPKNKHKFSESNTVRFFMNGEDHQYYVNNDIKRSLENLKGVIQIDEVLNTVANIARFQRQSITANPIFSIKQLLRDIPQAWTVGDFSLIRDLPFAFIDAITKGQFMKNKTLYNKFLEHGGGMNSVVSFDRSSFNAVQRASKKLKNEAGTIEIAKDETEGFLKGVLDRVRHFNEALENTPKMAQFKATLRETGDIEKAAFKGRDIMDFSRSGENVRSLNRYAAFINANIQGKSKQFRSLTTPGKRLSTGMKTMAVGAIPSIAAKMLYDNATENQQAVINEAPEWLRQTYWLFPHPDNDKVIRIPKPYEVALLSSTPLEFLMNNEDKIGTDGSDMLKEWFNQGLWVDPSLNPLTPIMEAKTGVDTFGGRDIVPQREQGLPANEQKDVYTASTAKGMAKLVNLIPGLDPSPRVIEHLMEGFSPVTGENVNDLIDRIGELTGLEKNVKPKGSSGVEHLNPFTLDISQRSSNLIGNAHESTSELQALKKKMQNEGKEFPYHNAYGANRKISNQDSDFAKTIRMIDNDPNLSRDQKRELRQQYVDQRNKNVRDGESAGLFNTEDSDNLASLESQFSDLERKQTKDDVRTQLSARLVQEGVPEYVVKEIMKKAKELKMSDEQLAVNLEQLIQKYQ